MIPTRFIDAAEYNKLLDMEGTDIIVVHALDAIDFAAPQIEGVQRDSITTDHVHLLFLNAIEPCIYFDQAQGGAFVILPKHDELTYEVLQEIHPNKGAWAYRITPHNWDDLDWDHHDLQYTNWWFKDIHVSAYAKDDWRTH